MLDSVVSFLFGTVHFDISSLGLPDFSTDFEFCVFWQVQIYPSDLASLSYSCWLKNFAFPFLKLNFIKLYFPQNNPNCDATNENELIQNPFEPPPLIYFHSKK